MASLYRLATGALLDTTPRKVVSSSFSRSAVPSSATLSAEPFGSPSVREIFDIFDVPVKLRERGTPSEPLKALDSLSTARVASRAGPSHSQSIYSDTIGLPWSLPPPLTFDGPACPPHVSLVTLTKRRQQRQSLIPRKVHGSSAVSCSAFTSQSEPLCQLFDGPSRATCYRYPRSQNERYSFTYISLALGLSSAFGWLALKDTWIFFNRIPMITIPASPIIFYIQICHKGLVSDSRLIDVSEYIKICGIS
ncbi:hypothetical protein J3R83DRAFT_13795 [Lanmaoa asiatica]|nr:hypothetical protein J3R83DRAFT_13795 [Lanmaoa asiatica]